MGDVVKIWYLDEVPTLVESAPAAGQESTPSKVPALFHWDVLLNGMVIELLNKDQRLSEGQFWEERYAKGLARFVEYIGQMGGEANRAYMSKTLRRYRYNDQRYRGL